MAYRENQLSDKDEDALNVRANAALHWGHSPRSVIEELVRKGATPRVATSMVARLARALRQEQRRRGLYLCSAGSFGLVGAGVVYRLIGPTLAYLGSYGVHATMLGVGLPLLFGMIALVRGVYLVLGPNEELNAFAARSSHSSE